MPDNFDYNSEEFSLESILAEYKGSAYIDGDRKSHSSVLDTQIQKIIDESQNGIYDSEFYVSSDTDLGDTGYQSASDNKTEASTMTALGETDTITQAPKIENNITDNIEYSSEPKDSVSEDKFSNDSDFDENNSLNELAEPFITDKPLRFFKRKKKVFSCPDNEENNEMAVSPDSENDNVGSNGERLDSSLSSQLNEETINNISSSDIKSDQFVPDVKNDNISDSQAVITNKAAEIEEPIFSNENLHKSENPAQPEFNDTEQKTEILFFDDYQFSKTEEGKEFETTWQETFVEQNENTAVEDYQKPAGNLPSVISCIDKIAKRLSFLKSSDSDTSAEPSEEKYIEEPDFSATAEEFARKRHSGMIKSRISLLIAFIMTVITILYERGISLPGIEMDACVLTIVLYALMTVVMALSLNLLVRGVEYIVHLQPNMESILVLSCAAVSFSCFQILYLKKTDACVPFCCVSAFALSISQWAEYRQYAGMYLSLKTAAASEFPDVYSSAYDLETECNVIKHFNDSAAGFYNNLVSEDVSEHYYRVFAPILIILALLFSVIGAIASKCSFSRCLSASLSAACSFGAMSSFSIPFAAAARRLRKSGSAIAGWGGTDGIYYADGIRLCEYDLFPAGATITDVKVFNNRDTEKIIRYTGSILLAAESGLAKPFSDFMDKQGVSSLKIESYEICAGGFSAFVRNENVLCGTAACLSLYGVQIPQELNLKNAIYVALDGTLSGIFTVAYRPTKNVQSALLAMLHSRLKLFIAGRDFNISPAMIQQKLQIPVDSMEYLSFKEACSISSNEPEKIPQALAVSVHSTPGTMAEVLVTAKRLWVISRINTIVSLIATFIGMFVILFLCRIGTESSVSPSNLCEYMLAIEAIILLISRIV